MRTNEQYDKVIQQCTSVFINKMMDYGLSWRILRPSSITDQIFIKASRIRSLEEKKTSKINEGVEPEYIGIINYSIMAIIQLKFPDRGGPTIDNENMKDIYKTEFNMAKDLMNNKNHDYDEAWRGMRISSLTDIILQKLLRIKQIEDNDGLTKVSEGLEANYYDIINYSVFALIKISEKKESPNNDL